jgi:hypothetical protein
MLGDDGNEIGAHSALRTRHSTLETALFRFSFWDGRLEQIALAEILFPATMPL